MKQINVKIPALPRNSYPIYIGQNFLDTLLTKIQNDHPDRSLFIITDSNLAENNHLKKLTAEKDIPNYIINPPGEKSKHIQTVVKIIEKMEQQFYARDSLIIALGGGTVGDIAGFAAAVYKRGIHVIQIPTTTVAQADSSVGGKTGVDSTISKNAFGAFWNPRAVYIDVATLNTLDQTQYLAGLVESLKHALIADEKYFTFFEKNIDKIINRDIETLLIIAEKNCRIKAKIVAEDPTEKNKRRILNYGHTVGHAAESASRFELLHGQAVAIGIIAAGLIEQKMKLAEPDQLRRIKILLEKMKMPTKMPKNIKSNQIIQLIKRDKKAVNKWPKFVLLEKTGKALCKNQQWAHDVAPETVKDVLAKLY
jgi:3-dehydroquinate synthase